MNCLTCVPLLTKEGSGEVLKWRVSNLPLAPSLVRRGSLAQHIGTLAYRAIGEMRNHLIPSPWPSAGGRGESRNLGCGRQHALGSSRLCGGPSTGLRTGVSKDVLLTICQLPGKARRGRSDHDRTIAIPGR